MSRLRLSLLALSILAAPASAQANWWDDVGPIKDPEKAKLASRMGIYSQGGWNQLMQGSTGGIPNAFLANAALHPEAQVMVGGMSRQLGDSKQAPTFSWQRLTPGAAEQMLAGTPPTAPPAQQGQSSGRLELTYQKRSGAQKVVTVSLSAARQLVVGSSGHPIMKDSCVQFLRQSAAGLRTVRSRPVVGVRLFPAAR